MAHQVLERIQQLAYNTNHKQGATKLLKLLNKYLLMVTFENSNTGGARIFSVFGAQPRA